MPNYIGVDVSKDSFDVFDGKVFSSFTNDEQGFKSFAKHLSAFDQPTVCMEATGHYFSALALFCHQHSFKVCVLNPLQVKRFMQSHLLQVKTDAQDAKWIREFAIERQPVLWQPQSEAISLLTDWLKFESLLIGQITQLSNQQSMTVYVEVLKVQKQQLKIMKKQLKEVRDRIKKSLESNDELSVQVQLLESIPGISQQTAAKVLAYIGSIDKFKRAKQLVSFIGLNPVIEQSGKTLNRSRLSKTGNRRLRKALYMPALSAIRYNPVIRDYSDSLKARKMPGKKRVIAAMRKLCHLIFAVLKHQKPFDPEFAIRS